MGGFDDRVERLVTRHTTVPLALRAAVAAVVAWLVVHPFGGAADEYPYYAPLGAVVSVSTTVLTSIRTAAQTAVSLVAGAALAIAALLLPVPLPVGIGLVVGIGTLVGSARRLGGMGSWVPISAIFILVIGHTNPWRFVPAYLGLTTLGALVGLGINTAVPPLRFAQAHRAQEELRSVLVEQLDRLADGLEEDPPPTSQGWSARRFDVESRTQAVRQLLAEATDGPPVNWRVRRRPRQVDRLRTQGRALLNLALLVDDLTEVLAGCERTDRDGSPLDPELRPDAARALRGLADVLRSVEDSVAAGTDLRRAWTAARELADEVRGLRRRTGNDLFEAGALLTGIQRTLESVTPDGSDLPR